jgi:hypothetical protein
MPIGGILDILTGGHAHGESPMSPIRVMRFKIRGTHVTNSRPCGLMVVRATAGPWETPPVRQGSRRARVVRRNR